MIPIKRPWKPEDVRTFCQMKHSAYTNALVKAKPGLAGAVRSEMGILPDEERKLVLSYLFREDGDKLVLMSSRELRDSQVLALKDWIGAAKIEDKWLPSQWWENEYRAVSREALRLYQGQMGMIQETLPMVGEAVMLGGVITRTYRNERKNDKTKITYKFD